MAKQKESAEEPLHFEQCLAQLEEIVQQLEGGGLGLADSLSKYEQGVKHLKRCYRALEEAERKIELLAGVDADGNPVTEAFDDADMALEEKAAARSRRRTRPADGPANEGGVDDSGSLF